MGPVAWQPPFPEALRGEETVNPSRPIGLGYIVNCHARHKMRSWEIIADNLKKAGWSLGYVSALDSQGRTIWIADAHRDDGKRFVVARG
jgi:hypothetical protein